MGVFLSCHVRWLQVADYFLVKFEDGMTRCNILEKMIPTSGNECNSLGNLASLLLTEAVVGVDLSSVHMQILSAMTNVSFTK